MEEYKAGVCGHVQNGLYPLVYRATEDEKTSSKKGAKKQQKEAEKAKRKAETAAKLVRIP